MIINGTNYRYEVVRITGTKQYALVDHNTDLVLAYGVKKDVTVAARLLSLGGTVALACALGDYYKNEGK